MTMLLPFFIWFCLNATALFLFLLDYTPMLAKNKFLGALHLCKSKICANGAIFATSLTSKLADSVLLDYTPMLAKNKFLGALHLCKSKICASGAIFATSLTSKLVDSVLLDYL